MPETSQKASTPFSSLILNYLGATVFTIGCMILMINAVLSIVPFFEPTPEQAATLVYVECALSVLSSTFFVVGGCFALVQTVKANQEADNKATCEQDSRRDSMFDSDEKDKGSPDMEPQMFGSSPERESDDLETKSVKEPSAADTISTETQSSWKLTLTGPEIWMHYLNELGALGAATFLTSSIIFLSASIASIITLVQDREVQIWIRYLQLIAATGFVVASIMMMIHEQKIWWRPAWKSVRWYVNLWNLLGSVGFIICACFGILQNAPLAEYHFGMSYLWGSSAFLLAAFTQWYKTIKKKTIENMKRRQQNESEC